ncbi:MAG: toll/interleukin-1 receptor domain-containing protein [Promethearchaeota archaeon]
MADLIDLLYLTFIIIIHSLPILIGIVFFIRVKKHKITLLKYAGLYFITGGILQAIIGGFIINYIVLPYIGYDCLLLEYLHVFTSLTWWSISLMFAMYISLEFILTERRKTLLLCIFSSFTFQQAFLYVRPILSCLNLVPFTTITIFNIITPIPILTFFIGLNVLGFLIKGIKSKGFLRKKFLLLSIGFFLFLFRPFIWLLELLGLMVGIYIYENIWFSLLLTWNIFIQAPFIYFGLRPRKIKKSKEKKEEIPSEKAIELTSYLLKSQPEISTADFQTLVDKVDKQLKLFISYTTSDADVFKIKELAEILRNFDKIEDVLYYQDESYDNIIKFMNENIGDCDAVLLFCSPDALKSIPVEKEWTAADALGKPIIPVFYNSNHIPPLLQSRLGVEFNFYNIQENALNIYVTAIKKYISILNNKVI